MNDGRRRRERVEEERVRIVRLEEVAAVFLLHQVCQEGMATTLKHDASNKCVKGVFASIGASDVCLTD